MTARLKSATILIAIVAACLALDLYVRTDLQVFGLLILCLFLMGGWMELSAMLPTSPQTPFRALLLTATPVYLVLTGLDHRQGQCLLAPLGVFALFLVMILLQFRESNESCSRNLCRAVFGFAYITVLGSFLYKLRLLDHGLQMVLYVVAVTKLSDSSAYALGTAIGRHKLVPRISPAKTVEGMVGALVGGALFAVLLVKPLGCGLLSLPAAALFGLVLSGLAAVGDLVESQIKREAGVKDSGRLLLGLGGALDVLDSLLLTAPVGYLWLRHAAAG